MKHLKKLFEYYEEDADDKDMVNIIQDIKDLGFKVTINVKYIASANVDKMTFTSPFLPAAQKDSHKCYQINISKVIKSDTIDELSDLLYELQTVFSRLSDVGKVVHHIKIGTAGNRYRSSNQTSATVKLIVATTEKIEDGSIEKLTAEIKKAGYSAVAEPRYRGSIYVELNKEKMKNRPYSANRDSREFREWESERSARMAASNLEWNKIKKIARGLKIPVRGHVDTSGIRIHFAAKNVKTDVKAVS